MRPLSTSEASIKEGRTCLDKRPVKKIVLALGWGTFFEAIMARLVFCLVCLHPHRSSRRQRSISYYSAGFAAKNWLPGFRMCVVRLSSLTALLIRDLSRILCFPFNFAPQLFEHNNIFIYQRYYRGTNRIRNWKCVASYPAEKFPHFG